MEFQTVRDNCCAMATLYKAGGYVLWGLFLTSHHYSVEAVALHNARNEGASVGRERTNINEDWSFKRFESNPDGLIYDNRPDTAGLESPVILKPWILPSANDFINDPADHHQRPAGNPGSNVSYTQNSFDDSDWEQINLPHDWAIAGPFQQGDDPTVDGGMGRLPVNGVGWYRKSLPISSQDEGKSIYLDIDGAMSYAMVWLNGDLIGGWP